MSETTGITPYKHPLLIVIGGWPTAGKTMATKTLRNQDKWFFGNIEQKQIPFRNSFKAIDISDTAVFKRFLANVKPLTDIEGTIFDGMDMYLDKWENENVKGSGNGLASWAEYQENATNIIQKEFRQCKRDVILTWHYISVTDEKTALPKDSLAMKGGMGKKGAEAYFTNIFTAKCMDLVDLLPYQNDLLHITPDDEARGFKHVLQTQKTKDTRNEPTRTLDGAFSIKETYVDCDIQQVLDRLHKFTEENY